MSTLHSDRASGHTSDARSNENGATGLGDILRRAREESGLTLQQVANEMKISRLQLEALERGNFTNVPTGFYQRAQIRAYARVVHLDQDLALAELERVHEPSTTSRPAPEQPNGTEPALFRRRLLIGVAVIVVGLALGRAIVGRERLGGDTEGSSSNPSPELSAPAVAVDNPVETTPRQSGSEPSGRLSTAAEQLDRVAPRDRGDLREPEQPTQSLTPASEDALPAAVAAEDAAAIRATVPPTGRPTVLSATPLETRRAGSAPAEPAEPEVVPAAATSLVVTTEPAGARVTVNGIAWGVTPVTIRYLPTGDKRIRVSKDGFAAQERAVRLSEGRAENVAIDLRTAP